MGLQCTLKSIFFGVYLDFYVFIFHDGYFDQQQAVPKVRQSNHQSSDVYEVLSLQ